MKVCEGGDFSVRKVPSLALPPEKTEMGKLWGRGRFSKRSASPPDPLSRRVAGVRVGFFSKLYVPVSWARIPVSWLRSRRLCQPP